MTPNGVQVTGGSPVFGRRVSGNNCNGWTWSTAGTYNGFFVGPPGGGTDVSICSTPRHLACCNGAPKTQFAGFLALRTPGAVLSGRAGMHAACATEFPGAHFCHVAEYLRAASATAVPAVGAWIDSSVDNSGSLQNEGLSSGGRAAYGNNCSQWTWSMAGTYNGAFLDSPAGDPDVSVCSTARSVACCR